MGTSRCVPIQRNIQKECVRIDHAVQRLRIAFVHIVTVVCEFMIPRRQLSPYNKLKPICTCDLDSVLYDLGSMIVAAFIYFRMRGRL